MQKFLLPALLSSVLFSAAAWAQENPNAPCCRSTPKWYGSISGGAAFLQDTDISNPFGVQDRITYSVGYAVSGAIGYKVLSGVRTELELAYRTNNADNGPPALPNVIYPQRSVAIMANAYCDFHNTTEFTPYVGAGVGPANVQTPRYYTPGGNATGKVAGWTVAYQFMMGVNYELKGGTNPVEVGFGYRYFTGQDMETKLKGVNGSFSVPNDSHNVEVAARMYF